MGVFGKRTPSHLIPVSPDSAASNDWVVLLEAGTIVGPSPDRLRVAKSTLEKKIVKRYNFFLRATHFLDVGRIRSTNSRRVFLSSTLQI
jgi:hypothetical protein